MIEIDLFNNSEDKTLGKKKTAVTALLLALVIFITFINASSSAVQLMEVPENTNITAKPNTVGNKIKAIESVKNENAEYSESFSENINKQCAVKPKLKGIITSTEGVIAVIESQGNILLLRQNTTTESSKLSKSYIKTFNEQELNIQDRECEFTLNYTSFIYSVKT